MTRLPLSSMVRVQPFTGLVVDADTWATAHDYHRRHLQLHLLSLHGRGIACGLEVFPTDPPSDTVVVEPGLAIDSSGNVVVVPEHQRLTLEAAESTAYVALDYVESLPATSNAGQQETRGRLVEDFRLRVLGSEPEAPALELARVRVEPAAKLAVTSPLNAWYPGVNEIDNRFRPTACAQPRQEMSIGLVVCGSEDDLDAHHLQGLYLLLRELRACGLHSTVIVEDDARADILYVTGRGSTQPSPSMIKRVGDAVKGGSWLFVDACGGGSVLTAGLGDLVKEGQKAGAEVEACVLTAHFVFGTPPVGATAGEVKWGRNTVISSCDYGCAWAGRRGKDTLPREQIRSALEFGVNVMLYVSGAQP